MSVTIMCTGLSSAEYVSVTARSMFISILVSLCIALVLSIVFYSSLFIIMFTEFGVENVIDFNRKIFGKGLSRLMN